MTNRREFLHIGVAALSLPIAARARVVPEVFGSAEPDATEALYKVYFDERFQACVAFADVMQRQSMPTHAIRGDITGIWFGDLYARWKEKPAAIAGITAPGAIFCLEMLARDAGMRIAFRADHRLLVESQIADIRRIEHEITGPAKVLRQASDLETSGAQWPQRMAELVARFPAERDAATQARFTGSVASSGDHPRHLVTWVIAPVRRG